MRGKSVFDLEKNSLVDELDMQPKQRGNSENRHTYVTTGNSFLIDV